MILYIILLGIPIASLIMGLRSLEGETRFMAAEAVTFWGFILWLYFAWFRNAARP